MTTYRVTDRATDRVTICLGGILVHVWGGSCFGGYWVEMVTGRLGNKHILSLRVTACLLWTATLLGHRARCSHMSPLHHISMMHHCSVCLCCMRQVLSRAIQSNLQPCTRNSTAQSTRWVPISLQYWGLPAINDRLIRLQVKRPSLQSFPCFAAGNDQNHFLQFATNQPVCTAYAQLATVV